MGAARCDTAVEADGRVASTRVVRILSFGHEIRHKSIDFPSRLPILDFRLSMTLYSYIFELPRHNDSSSRRYLVDQNSSTNRLQNPLLALPISVLLRQNAVLRIGRNNTCTEMMDNSELLVGGLLGQDSKRW